MEKLVKVKYVLDRHRVKWIEVKESEVEAVKEANRMMWREVDKERRDKKILEEMGLVLCSLEHLEDVGESIMSDTLDPLDKLIAKEEAEERTAMLKEAISHLPHKQQRLVEMIYFDGDSQDEVAEHFGVSKSAISHAMSKIYKKLEKYFKNF